MTLLTDFDPVSLEALADADLRHSRSSRQARTTSFERLTFATVAGAECVTCDLGIRLAGPTVARPACATISCWSRPSQSTATAQPSDNSRRWGSKSSRFSKYRVGMSRVGGAVGFGDHPVSELFTTERRVAFRPNQPPAPKRQNPCKFDLCCDRGDRI